jgi:hypothetical protein
LLACNNTPIARAQELAATITPVDETPELASVRIERFLTTGMALHGLGITTDRNIAHYTLVKEDGKESTVQIKADIARG